MQCIGNIDESKTLLEQLDDYEVNGYRVKDLKPGDKECIWGMAYVIDQLDLYEPLFAEDEGSVIGKMKREIADEMLGDIVQSMLGELGMMLFSIMDNDEDYWENGEEDAAQPVLQPAT